MAAHKTGVQVIGCPKTIDGDLKNEDIERVMEENRVALNAMLPAYSQILKMKIYPEEFEKTPKKSIKRYLYQEAKG